MRGHLEGAGAHFLGAWQGGEIGTGALAAGGVEVGSPRFGLEGRMVVARFLQGSEAPDPSLSRVKAAGFGGLGLGFRLQPFFDFRGPWLGATFSGLGTGSLVRVSFDARIGWDFRFSDGFVLGPYVGYLQVFQPDDALRPEDARLAIFGVHGALYREPSVVRHAPPKGLEATPPAPEPKLVRCGAQGCVEPIGSHPLTLPDRCPDEPEDFIGASDADGCPKDAEVKVVGDEIVLNDRVYFDFGLARVKHKSWPLLKSLAKMILAHPEYVVVHIHGHTDEIGDDYWNQILSDQRAAAVRKKLMEYGVPEKRLVSKGFGKTKPRVAGKDEAARQENRRVEFLIERQLPAKGAKP